MPFAPGRQRRSADAFNFASAVSAGVTLVAAAVVAYTLSRRKERAAAAEAPAPAWATAD